ncbi:MAG: S8 family serine peptidase, partial [Candidatus Eisenbacteria bacterium]
MRAPIRRYVLLLSCLTSANAGAALSPEFTTGSPGGEGSRECVVQLAAPAPGTRLARAREELARRAATAGLEMVASLGTNGPAISDPPSLQTATISGSPGLRSTTTSESPGRRAATTPANPFDLDPERVLLLRARDAAALRAAMTTLRDDPAIEWFEPNFLREPCDFPADLSLPDDPLLRDTRQWGLWNAGAAGVYRGSDGADIGVRSAWALSCGSNHLRLAVADTGVDPNHPDLTRALPDGSPRLVAARNVSTGAATAWADSNGHGTAVAGVMAALTHDGAHFDSLGTAGVCGGDGRGNAGCRLVPIKISPGSTGISSSFEIARAIVHATDSGCRAMNLSFAGGGGSRVERMALYYAITRGCVVVAASGNRGHLSPPAVLYPAAFAAQGLCVAVGASDARDRRAMFSSYGAGLDLVAPGLDVWTTALTYPSAYGARFPGYVAASGTSFAAPHVTGTIGLMAALRPGLTDTDFQRLLRAAARDIGTPGWDAETAWGRLDAAAAVRAVADAPGARLG